MHYSFSDEEMIYGLMVIGGICAALNITSELNNDDFDMTMAYIGFLGSVTLIILGIREFWILGLYLDIIACGIFGCIFSVLIQSVISLYNENSHPPDKPHDHQKRGKS